MTNSSSSGNGGINLGQKGLGNCPRDQIWERIWTHRDSRGACRPVACRDHMLPRNERGFNRRVIR